jgi:uncharacterized protein YbbK (DUF523 family)
VENILLVNRCAQRKPRVGISACLCGDRVRYDGLSKGLPGLITELEHYLELHKICPEVAIGMGTPRAPIQLSKNTHKIQAIGVENPQHNVTNALADYAKTLQGGTHLCGYIFKSRSPSCGAGSTPIHKNGAVIDVGNGIFSQQIQQQWPWLPIAEEQQLVNTQQQQFFIMLSRLVDQFFNMITAAQLDNFHRQVAVLRALLPPATQDKLMQIPSDDKWQNPTHYLSQLIQALQRLPFAVIKELKIPQQQLR